MKYVMVDETGKKTFPFDAIESYTSFDSFGDVMKRVQNDSELANKMNAGEVSIIAEEHLDSLRDCFCILLLVASEISNGFLDKWEQAIYA